MVQNFCPYLYWATTDFTIGDQVLLTFGIIQHNLKGLTAERTIDGSGRHRREFLPMVSQCGQLTGLVTHPDRVPTANNRFTDASDPDVLGGVVVCQSH